METTHLPFIIRRAIHERMVKLDVEWLRAEIVLPVRSPELSHTDWLNLLASTAEVRRERTQLSLRRLGYAVSG